MTDSLWSLYSNGSYWYIKEINLLNITSSETKRIKILNNKKGDFYFNKKQKKNCVCIWWKIIYVFDFEKKKFSFIKKENKQIKKTCHESKARNSKKRTTETNNKNKKKDIQSHLIFLLRIPSFIHNITISFWPRGMFSLFSILVWTSPHIYMWLIMSRQWGWQQ